MNKETAKYLAVMAAKIRKHAMNAIYNAQSGHPGGSLSVADILSILYFHIMNIDANNPVWEDRDRLVLSKGHCAPALYGALAEKGFFPAHEIERFRHIDSFLQGHPDMKCVPGVDMSTGSLGLGISAGNGMAVAGKMFNKDYHVYAILGDGELEEGQVWEAAMFAAHYKLDNLTAFVDFNGLQIDGYVYEVMSPLPIDRKFKAFGWNVILVNGHNFEEIENAVNRAKHTKGKPTAIIAATIKGKGVSYMEDEVSWHSIAPNKEQYEQAIAELDQFLSKLEVE